MTLRPARLLLNRVPNRGHWLLIRAVDPKLKRDAYGAVVTVSAGGRSQVRHVLAAGSYQSSSDPRVHFGLGGGDHVDSIQVLWPGGDEESFPGDDATHANRVTGSRTRKRSSVSRTNVSSL